MPRRASNPSLSFRPFDDPHIGIDEAGRGCLAGPVVAAAVLFPPGSAVIDLLPGLTDSKKLSAAAREALFPAVKRHCLCWSVGLAWPEEIDRINILNATFRAMARAASRLRLPHRPHLPGESHLSRGPEGAIPLLAVDGNHHIRPDAWRAVTHLPLPQQCAVIRGDALVPAISAASILAKVFRDSLMVRLDRRYPGYGFAAHKGYGTADHLAAVASLGSCALHRKTFRKIRPEQEQLSLL